MYKYSCIKFEIYAYFCNIKFIYGLFTHLCEDLKVCLLKSEYSFQNLLSKIL